MNSRCRHRQLTNRVNCERNKQGHYFPNNIFSKSIKCTVILFLEYNFFSNEKAKILQNRRMKNFVCFLLSSVVCFFCLKQENTHDPKVYRWLCTLWYAERIVQFRMDRKLTHRQSVWVTIREISSHKKSV